MSIPELFFKNPKEVISWHEKNMPGSADDFEKMKLKIAQSGFPRSAKLIRNVEKEKNVTNFLSFAAELNIANVLLNNSPSNLAYESMSGVDFTFDDVAMSVKNLHPKNYQKNEQARIEELQIEGGGKTTFTHKNFSNVFMEVKKTAWGAFGWERTETGHAGFLDSDLEEMSAPLKYLGEFEDVNCGGLKKVMFFMVQSKEFHHYHVDDISRWYFDRLSAHPIFQVDMSWYYKLFTKGSKNNSVDGLVFMFAPINMLCWPAGCMQQIRHDKPRLIILAREKELHDKLKRYLSN